MKKAIKWLESIGQDYIFHDYRKEGLNETTLKTWVDQFGLVRWSCLFGQVGS